MLDKYLQIETISIVFLGKFNPVIVQPYWLVAKNLIREDEAKNAKIEIIHDEIIKYQLDWIDIELTKLRCEFKSSKVPYFEAVKDLANGIFKFLKETPIQALGINHVYDLSLSDDEKYYDFGNKLAPLVIWQGSLNDARLTQLEVYEKLRYDSLPGHYRVRITPSDQEIAFGVQINLNDHFDSSNKDRPGDLEMINRLNENWDKSFQRSKQILEDLLTKLSY